MSEMAFEVELDENVDHAIERVTAALKEEGFGVLTRIDVDTTLREKLDVAFRRYVILGACNPALAHRALQQRSDVGLMLPCNVTVEAREGGGSVIRLVDPAVMLEAGPLADDPTIRPIAAEARERFERVAAAIRDAA